MQKPQSYLFVSWFIFTLLIAFILIGHRSSQIHIDSMSNPWVEESSLDFSFDFSYDDIPSKRLLLQKKTGESLLFWYQMLPNPIDLTIPTPPP